MAMANSYSNKKTNPELVCRLWDDSVKRNANDVKAAAQQMIQELQKDKAELVSKMVVDIPK